MTSHIVIATLLFAAAAVAASNGNLMTERITRVSQTLAIATPVLVVIGASRFLSEDFENARVWFTWAAIVFVGASVIYGAAFWLHARFELPVKRQIAK
jgi:hypothetical protein